MIALTATVAFARDYRDSEESEGLRVRISERQIGRDIANNNTIGNMVSTAPLAIDSETGNVYQVELQRGGELKVVLIEAHTGKVIRSMKMSDKIS